MISTPFRSKNLINTRSVSLPTRSHPLIPQFNDHLQKLKPSDSTTSISLPSITKKLNNLEELYDCVHDLLILPHTHQVFAKDLNEKWVEETLDGYLRLVDACATAKDFAFQAKLDVQDLLSVLRRRQDVDDHLCEFLNSRKNTKKMIHKSLRSIGSFKNKATVFGLDKDQETIAVISMLKAAESVTFDLIEVLLSSISGTKTSGWSLVSRLIKSRKNSGNNHCDTPEFEELDAILYKIFGYRTAKGDSGVEIDDLMHQLREIDLRIQVVEERLECLFKRLITTRVSLLNMQSL